MPKTKEERDAEYQAVLTVCQSAINNVNDTGCVQAATECASDLWNFLRETKYSDAEIFAGMWAMLCHMAKHKLKEDVEEDPEKKETGSPA